MNEITYKGLQELTGYESGAVLYEESGEIIICNWSNIEGLPRMFATGLIGMGETLTAELLDETPAEVITAMNKHEDEQGTEQSTSGFTAWRLNGIAIVTIQEDWN